MEEPGKASCKKDEIVVQMSPWGEFFIWVAEHVELLRRKHRIVGHLSGSFSTFSGSSRVDISHPSDNTVRLPLLLSLEETVLLLFHGLAAALDCVCPVRCLHPPSPRSLFQFDIAIALHNAESIEILKEQRRQRMLSYASEIRRGRRKRKAKETEPVCSKNSADDDAEIGVKLSKKRLKKLANRKRRELTSEMEYAADCMQWHPSDDEAEVEDQMHDTNEIDECRPTLAELTTSSSTDEAKLAKSIPFHTPRPTPKEWRRSGEHELLVVPESSRDSIEKIVLWLLEVSSKSRPEEHEAAIVRCKVFNDLWSKGFFVTCSASKMGGDFLVYQGDPLLYHASHIVIASPPQAPIFLSRLSASLRIANSVRKALVIATTPTAVGESDQGNYGPVAYTSLYWTGFRAPPSGVQDVSMDYSGVSDAFHGNQFYYYDDEEYENSFEYYDTHDMSEAFVPFCGNIIKQVWPNIWISLVACLVWRGCRSLFQFLLSRTVSPNYLSRVLEGLLNGLSIILGILLLRHFFDDLYIRPCAFIFTIGVLLSSLATLRGTTSRQSKSQGALRWTSEMVFTTVFCLLLQFYCEFFINPREWHMIRGTIMLLVMKVISVSAPSSHYRQGLKMGFLRHYLAWCGYAFSPGSVIFGPWFDFDVYLHATQLSGPNQGNSLPPDLIRFVFSCSIAVGCIIYSTYLSSILYANYLLSFQWTSAYAQSQSFRFSHYFVSFFSQSLHQAIGFAVLTHPQSSHNYATALVAKPLSVEIPRSLVDVVISWNLPMHLWLKQYIYKPTRRFGQLPALLLTYAFSSLLHGLNFQLAAVLFSIGIYAYIDFIFRSRLSARLDACVGARPCPPLCPHSNTPNSWWVRILNLLFTCLSIFHLSYLAVMFDTSEEQEKGYNMFHVLDKWANLNFLSHIVAVLTYLLCPLI